MSIRIGNKIIASNTVSSVDSTPIEGSENPISSGGVYNALQNKQDNLTAGENITIENGVISSLGGGANEDLSNITILGQQVINNPYPRFCVNSGSVNDDGEPDFVTIENSLLTAKSPFVFTTASGLTVEVKQDLTHTFNSDFSGTIFLDVNESLTAVSLVVGGEYFIQKIIPTNPIENYTVWVDTSIFPEISYLYTSSGWIETNRVPVGDFEYTSTITPTELTEEPTEE